VLLTLLRAAPERLGARIYTPSQRAAPVLCAGNCPPHTPPVLTQHTPQEVARHKKTIKTMKSGLVPLPLLRVCTLRSKCTSMSPPFLSGSRRRIPLFLVSSTAFQMACAVLSFALSLSLSLFLFPLSFSTPARDRHIMPAGTARKIRIEPQQKGSRIPPIQRNRARGLASREMHVCSGGSELPLALPP
jgi:hypothetical protein